MDAETLKALAPILVAACTPILAVIGAAIAAVWYYATKVRGPVKDKERQVTSAYTREQERSLAVFDQQEESKGQAALIETFMAMARHLIESNNGHMSSLTKEIIDGFKEAIGAIVGGNSAITLLVLDRFKEVAIEQAKQAASINQLNYFLQERAGRPIAGGDTNTLKAAELRTDAVKRSDDIVQAVDVDIQAKREEAAHVGESAAEPQPPTLAAGQQVIAIVEAKKVEGDK